jgi:hypothetical protein
MKKLILIIMLIYPSPSQAVHDEYEDAYDRYNGPPLYRYHDKLSHQDSYKRYETDANDYWGSRYHGNEDPNRQYEHFLDRAITEMEEQR